MSRVEQIVAFIRGQIQSGHYQSQQRLLSIRAGAVHFQVSKNTMAEAYERLVAEGDKILHFIKKISFII